MSFIFVAFHCIPEYSKCHTIKVIIIIIVINIIVNLVEGILIIEVSEERVQSIFILFNEKEILLPAEFAHIVL